MAHVQNNPKKKIFFDTLNSRAGPRLSKPTLYFFCILDNYSLFAKCIKLLNDFYVTMSC